MKSELIWTWNLEASVPLQHTAFPALSFVNLATTTFENVPFCSRGHDTTSFPDPSASRPGLLVQLFCSCYSHWLMSGSV